MKKGSYKYLLQLLHGIRREIHELRRTQRYMIQGLEHTFLFDDDYIKTIDCNDEIDQEILDVLYMAGPPRKLPRDIAKHAAEKRGSKWTLTNWAYENWGSTKEEVSVRIMT